jgi:hypothetical protein
LRVVSDPEPEPVNPLTSWQRTELWALVVVIAVQLWLYQVSVVAAAAWGVLVPALVIHMSFWMVPLVRQQRNPGERGEREHP